MRANSGAADAVPGDAEEYHVDDPCDEGDEEREERGEGHEDGACAVVCRAAETEEDCEARKRGTNGVQDKRTREVVDDMGVEIGVNPKIRMW